MTTILTDEQFYSVFLQVENAQTYWEDLNGPDVEDAIKDLGDPVILQIWRNADDEEVETIVDSIKDELHEQVCSGQPDYDPRDYY